jgi:DnaJ family protein A protein 2
VVKHLDGRGIELQHPKTPGQILSPGQVLKVPGEGMPIKRSDSRGDLYLIVNIKFPDEQWKPSAAVLERLKEMLPKPDVRIPAETVDEVEYDPKGNAEDFGSKDPSGGSAWEDDDEEEGGTAQCATQ